ncbi:MAG: O-antigen ligase family protein [Anaerolineales bacterium]|nr:O-antigen ligase family protein [Chloroflexota bacterium]MBL6979833.1 O-antigen ligase family protein [Anaerolineales bacterium]
MRLSWFPIAQKIVWAIFLISLPVTSFPFFPGGVGGRTEVRPLSLYPLVILVILVTIPRLLSKPIPKTAFPLGAFGLAAIASTTIAFTQGIDPDIGITVSSRTFRMLVTLAIGIAFYITVAVTPSSKDEMRFSLRWLYGGFVMALLWGSIQISYILFYSPEYFDFIEHLQGFISVRGLFETRISGMTYEPNWFAEQISFLLMPWLFAAVLSNYTAFRWRLRWLTVEMLLLVWASVVLIYTYSRTGYVLWVVQLVLAFMFRPRKVTDKGKPWGMIAKRVLQVGVLVVAIGVIVFIAGSRNRYFSRLWNYWSDENAAGSYIQYIAVSQRIAYWETAYRIYDEYPWMGIGLGNYTFYFEEKLSDRPLFPTPELLLKFTPADGRNRVVVPKNMFVRILAETGLLGTAAFLAFLVGVLGCALYLFMTPHPEARYLGQAGLLSLVVFLGVAFSVDSFAVPNMWVLFGLVTASAQIFSRPSILSSEYENTD